MVEAARGYSHNARVTRKLMKRQEDVPEGCRKDRLGGPEETLQEVPHVPCARGKENNKTVVAIARELAGFIWAHSAAGASGSVEELVSG